MFNRLLCAYRAEIDETAGLPAMAGWRLRSWPSDDEAQACSRFADDAASSMAVVFLCWRSRQLGPRSRWRRSDAITTMCVSPKRPTGRPHPTAHSKSQHIFTYTPLRSVFSNNVSIAMGPPALPAGTRKHNHFLCGRGMIT